MPFFYKMIKLKNLPIILIIFFLLFANDFSYARVFLKKNEALNQAFPNADQFVKEQVFLNPEQVKNVELLSRSKLKSKLYIFYKATSNGNILGYALIDTHLLRTTTETVMFVINKDGTLREIEILAFFEPTDYMPGNKWVNLFNRNPLEDSLRVGKKIPNITGATITSNSFTKAARKVLAIYKVVFLDKNLLAEKEEN